MAEVSECTISYKSILHQHGFTQTEYDPFVDLETETSQDRSPVQSPILTKHPDDVCETGSVTTGRDGTAVQSMTNFMHVK